MAAPRTLRIKINRAPHATHLLVSKEIWPAIGLAPSLGQLGNIANDLHGRANLDPAVNDNADGMIKGSWLCEARRMSQTVRVILSGREDRARLDAIFAERHLLVKHLFAIGPC